jgi:hypothetical protein
MPGLKPIDPLLTRALKRAISLLEAVLVGNINCRELVRGETPAQIRKELADCRRLLSVLEPRRKAAAG